LYARLNNEAPRQEDVWGSGGIVARFLTSALDGDECSASYSYSFTPGETAHDINCVGGWVDLRICLDVYIEEKNVVPLPGIQPLTPR
jgi:hypothetical protein